MAQVFGGASGDKTLEKVLSYSLIPFYETRRWKRVVTDEIGAVAATAIKGDGDITNIREYLKLLAILEEPLNQTESRKLSIKLAEQIGHENFTQY